MLGRGVTLKKSALTFLSNNDDLIDPKDIAKIALKTIKGYQKRIDDDPDQKAEILDDPKQLIQRVQNAVIFQVHDEIKQSYGGEKARWLPSSADEPRPEHQINYGKVYIIGEGIGGVEPGDEYGCQCGVEILVDETQLEL